MLFCKGSNFVLFGLDIGEAYSPESIPCSVIKNCIYYVLAPFPNNRKKEMKVGVGQTWYG